MTDFLLRSFIRSLGFVPDEVVHLPGSNIGFSCGSNHYVLSFEICSNGCTVDLYAFDYTTYNMDCKGEWLYFYEYKFKMEHSHILVANS